MSIARSSYLKNTTGGDFLDQKQGGTVLGQDLSLKDSAVSQDTNLKQNSTTTKIVSGGEFGRMRRGKYVIKGATTEIAALESFILSFLGTFASIFKNLFSRDTVAVVVIPDAPPPVCRFTVGVDNVNPELAYLAFYQNLSGAYYPIQATDDDYDFVIDWGDGSEPRTVQAIADFDDASNYKLFAPYTQTGTYNATITGKFDKGTLSAFQPQYGRMYIKSIEEWGGLKIDSYYKSIVFFPIAVELNNLILDRYASTPTNFEAIPSEAPVITVPRLDNIFMNCSNFNSPMNNWDVSGVTHLGGIFRDATIFNQPLDSWDTSNVINMNTVFHTNGMAGNAAFDQDISNWDFSSLTATDCLTYFGTGLNLSPANYDALLTKWQSQAQSIPENLTLVDMGTSRYTSSGAAARLDLVANYGWTISDGGAA